MKKISCFLAAFISITMLSSCATLFTSSKQSITFSGVNGTKIYDAQSNIKIAEIGGDNTATVGIKKTMDDKQILAKKEGYKTQPLVLESSFNKTALWNILFWPGFIVDFATGQMNKYDNSIIVLDMEKE